MVGRTSINCCYVKMTKEKILIRLQKEKPKPKSRLFDINRSDQNKRLYRMYENQNFIGLYRKKGVKDEQQISTKTLLNLNLRYLQIKLLN